MCKVGAEAAICTPHQFRFFSLSNPFLSTPFAIHQSLFLVPISAHQYHFLANQGTHSQLPPQLNFPLTPTDSTLHHSDISTVTLGPVPSKAKADYSCEIHPLPGLGDWLVCCRYHAWHGLRASDRSRVDRIRCQKSPMAGPLSTRSHAGSVQIAHGSSGSLLYDHLRAPIFSCGKLSDNLSPFHSFNFMGSS